MKENSLDSHNHVAQVDACKSTNNNNNNNNNNSGSSKPVLPSGNTFSNSDEDDFDDDNDWGDFGIGNLVIDLDADLERSTTSGGSSSSPSSSPSKPVNGPLNSSSSVPSEISDNMDQQHQGQGLKMKIKRTNKGGSKSDAKHEIVKQPESKLAAAAALAAEANNGNAKTTNNPSGGGGSVANMDHCSNASAAPNAALSPMKGVDKERNVKGRGAHKKDRARDRTAKSGQEHNVPNGGAFLVPSAPASTATTTTTISGGSNSMPANTTISASSAAANALAGNVSVELDRITTPFNMNKKESKNVLSDPYDFNEFNDKGEDRIGLPVVKKMKVEKTETASSPVNASSASVDVGVDTCSVGVATDPDCLGPCEPGTSVVLEGIVWHETENGILVVNVTWRGKTYVGTLLDATKHDLAPPRFSCDSPTSDLETRTPKGRGKRRAAANTPSCDVGKSGRELRKSRRSNSGTMAPPSPARSDISVSGKRKGRPAESDSDGPRAAKRANRATSSTRHTPVSTDSSGYIECPEPNCNKKYKHINGLRYHQTHAHHNNGSQATEADNDGDKETDMETDNGPSSPSTSDDAVKDAKGNIKDSEDQKDSSATGNRSKRGKNDKRKNSSPANANTQADKHDDGMPVLSAETDSPASNSKKKSEQATAPTLKEQMPDAKVKIETIKDVKQTKTDTRTSCSSDGVASSQPMYQIAGNAAAATVGVLGTVAVVSQPVTQVASSSPAATVVHATLAGQIPSVTTITAVPVAVTTAAASVISDDKNRKAKLGEKTDPKVKVKTTMAARPIMPAPGPQMAVTHGPGPLSTVSSHAQIAPISPTTQQLKPIQPRPTIMGDTTNPSQALAGLQPKDKKAKKKKVPTATLR